ncbi:MAG: polysaccharide deacetylase, partial [Pseudomonadota bacterium]
HISHEGPKKKQEFGPSRSKSEQKSDLERGRRRLESILGRHFFPVFTPPWNRCDADTLELLDELGYHAVSRSWGSRPPAPLGLLEFSVTVDLHTRKESDPAEAWEFLFDELFFSLRGGRCGIMIHHQRMNRAAFDFLEILLPALQKSERVCLVNFKHLVEIFSRIDLTARGGV